MAWRVLREPLGYSRKLGERLLDPPARQRVGRSASPLANGPKARSASVHDRSTSSRFNKRHFGARKQKNGPQTQTLGVLCRLTSLRFEANGGFTLRVASPQRPPSILLAAAAVPIHEGQPGQAQCYEGRHVAAHG
jgi:hypothetical protein